MKSLKIVLTGLFFLTSCNTLDHRPYESLNPELQKIIADCRACHESGDQTAPQLNGLESWHLREQVIKFKVGIRGHEGDSSQAQAMQMLVRDTPAKDLIAATNWFAAQERLPAEPSLEGDIKLGGELFEEHCSTCHVNTFLRIVTHSPKIDLLEDWYFVNQCNSFYEGRRGGVNDNDHGKSMAEKIKRVQVGNFKDIAAYIQSLQVTKD